MPVDPIPDDLVIDRDDVASVLDATAEMDDAAHALMYGPYGTGKTTEAKRSARPNQQIFDITITPGDSAASLWGHYIVGDDGVTRLHAGAVRQAWESGGLLVINEIDKANEDVMALLHVVMDDPEVASRTLADGTTTRPIQGFRVIATTNDPDPTVSLPGAVLDRFSVILNVDRPSPEMLEPLPDDVRAATVAIYDAAVVTPMQENDIDFRVMRRFAKFRNSMSPERAALVVAGTRERAQDLLEKVEMQRVAAVAATRDPVGVAEARQRVTARVGIE